MASYHMHIEVRAALRWPNSRLKGMFSRDGVKLTGEEVRDLLFDCLAAGKECIPCGKCDNFNYGKDGGCQGHEVTEGGA